MLKSFKSTAKTKSIVKLQKQSLLSKSLSTTTTTTKRQRTIFTTSKRIKSTSKASQLTSSSYNHTSTLSSSNGLSFSTPISTSFSPTHIQYKNEFLKAFVAEMDSTLPILPSEDKKKFKKQLLNFPFQYYATTLQFYSSNELQSIIARKYAPNCKSHYYRNAITNYNHWSNEGLQKKVGYIEDSNESITDAIIKGVEFVYNKYKDEGIPMTYTIGTGEYSPGYKSIDAIFIYLHPDSSIVDKDNNNDGDGNKKDGNSVNGDDGNINDVVDVEVVKKSTRGRKPKKSTTADDIIQTDDNNKQGDANNDDKNTIINMDKKIKIGINFQQLIPEGLATPPVVTPTLVDLHKKLISISKKEKLFQYHVEPWCVISTEPIAGIISDFDLNQGTTTKSTKSTKTQKTPKTTTTTATTKPVEEKAKSKATIAAEEFFAFEPHKIPPNFVFTTLQFPMIQNPFGSLNPFGSPSGWG